MWRLVLLVFLALCAPTSRIPADDKQEKKRDAELEERLRKAEPKEEDEIARKKANDQLIALLRKADKIELFRLEAEQVKDSSTDQTPSFHGWKVAFRLQVANAEERATLIASLGRELHWFDGWQALCFRPHHGMRAIIGKDVVDFVLCFECSKMKVYEGEHVGTVVLLGSKWEAADKLIQKAEGKQPAKK